MNWRFLGTLLIGCAAVALGSETRAADQEKVLRIGIIGCDTSHVPAFTKEFNNPQAEGDLAGFKVVAAFPGGSDDIPASKDRLEGFTEHLRDKGVEIVDSVDALVPKVDVVILESLDGRKHLEQARPVIAAGKPMFIDKPFAGSLHGVLEIYRLAAEHNTPIFSSSSLRYSTGAIDFRTNGKIGDILGSDVSAPCALEPHHPDLFWYGIHGTELLFTIMGPGCKSVSRTHTADSDFVVGVWDDGRIGTFRGLRKGKKQPYSATIFGSLDVAQAGEAGGYKPLVEQIGKFFHSGKSPVSAAETIEIYTFMEAADESKRHDGRTVMLKEVLDHAR